MRVRIEGILFNLFLLIGVSLCFAEEDKGTEEKPGPKAEAKPAMSLEEIKNLLGLSIYLQAGYTFNFNTPDSMTNEQRIFDQKANTFLIDLA